MTNNNNTAWGCLPKFESLLNTTGYKPSTISEIMIVIRKFLRYTDNDAENEVSFSTAYDFINHFYSDTTVSKSRHNFAKSSCEKFIRFVISNNIFDTKKTISIPQMSENDTRIFQKYQQEIELKNCEVTVKKKLKSVSLLLASLFKAGLSITDAGISEVLFYLNGKKREDWLYIKQFLSWLLNVEFISVDLSYLIIPPKRPIRIPVVYSESEIVCVLNSLDKSNSSYLRDHAILLILAFTGIRSCDIVNLRYDNFNFESHEMHLIQKKTGAPLRLMVSAQVLEAVQSYYQTSRPVCKCSELFLCSNAPIHPCSTALVRIIVKKAYMKAGIDISQKKHGSHSLRSSLASAMVNKGMDYEIVRKTLGHISADSLNRYVRIDIEKLKKCTLPAVEPVGNFKKWLEGLV